MEKNYYLMAFDSTHDAIASQKTLDGRVPVRVMPTLRRITAACGISLRVENADFPALRRTLAEHLLRSDAFRLYRVRGETVELLEIEA